ncbi:hypothetical protein G6F63_015898 [Rhizopus arrhizus]|nr:hypothetical protein G6F63_015898 [Rhizopus arrhizus]
MPVAPAGPPHAHGYGDQARGRRRHIPAAAHSEQCQQRQRPAKPIAGILPVDDAGLRILHRLEVLLRMQRDPVQVVGAGGKTAQRRARRARQALQRILVQP